MKEKNKDNRKINVGAGLVSAHNRGITLIALVITIIVMLILVAVTITVAVNGGLFGYAGNAVKETDIEKQKEIDFANLGPGMSTDQLIAKYTGEMPAYSESLLNEDRVLTQNVKYTSGSYTAVIPKGFAIVTGLDSIANGLVISDEFDSSGNSIGNEFVWIPVTEGTFIRTWFYDNKTFEEIAKSSDETLRSSFFTNYKSKDSRLSSQSTYENAITNNGDISSWEDIVNIVKTKLMANYTEPYSYNGATEIPEISAEYSKMVASVEKYKGFYIGRYEVGEKENGKIVVQRDKKPYTSIKWGDSMTSIGTTGAVYLARSMYEDDEETEEIEYGVVSTLCYGVQWDAMLSFIKDDSHNVNSSTTWGNNSDTPAEKWKITRRTAQYYKNSQWNAITEDLEKSTAGKVKLTTGANDNFQAKNIYDVAGNVFEWTMEASSSRYRVLRGGCCYDSGSDVPASYRNNNLLTNSGNNIGFRPTLYIR